MAGVAREKLASDNLLFPKECEKRRFASIIYQFNFYQFNFAGKYFAIKSS
jgi:hypothetical protein